MQALIYTNNIDGRVLDPNGVQLVYTVIAAISVTVFVPTLHVTTIVTNTISLWLSLCMIAFINVTVHVASFVTIAATVTVNAIAN